MKRVSVNAEALEALIDYAEDKRIAADSDCLASPDEWDESQDEFDRLVDALDERPE